MIVYTNKPVENATFYTDSPGNHVFFVKLFYAPKIFLHFYNNILKLKPAKQIVNCANCNANIVFNSPGMHVIVLKWSF